MTTMFFWRTPSVIFAAVPLLIPGGAGFVGIR